MKILKYLKLRRELEKRMTVVNETMALQEVTDIYAENVCKMNGWRIHVGFNGLSYEFCDIGFAFMNGYNKALRDNGLEFQNGLVKKRAITSDMPIGALKFYDENIRAKAKEEAIRCLRSVLSRYEPQVNVNTIINDFVKELTSKKENQ